MATISPKKAYVAYMSHGVVEGTALSAAEFDQLWHSLPDDDQAYWMEQFAAGPTQLSAEFIANVDVVEFDDRDAELAARIRSSFDERE